MFAAATGHGAALEPEERRNREMAEIKPESVAAPFELPSIDLYVEKFGAAAPDLEAQLCAALTELKAAREELDKTYYTIALTHGDVAIQRGRAEKAEAELTALRKSHAELLTACIIYREVARAQGAKTDNIDAVISRATGKES